MNSKCKKIALITPSLAKGGLEKVVVVGAKELEKYYDVTVIVMDSFRTDYPYEGKIIDLGLSWENRGLWSRLANFIKAIRNLRKIKKREQFDLVIGHGELASFPNILSGVSKNMVVIHENRFAAIKDFQGSMVNKTLKYLFSFKNVVKIVTVSEGIRVSLIERLGIDGKQIMTIHNPYEIHEINTLSKEPIEKPYQALFSHPVLVVAGRLMMAKGHWYLLRIFAALKRKDPDIKLLILGEGILQEKLIDMSGTLGLHTYSVWDDMHFNEEYDVYFMGFQKNPFKYIAASRLFAMTSVWEGFGNTIVEAMACSTAVISTDCPSGPGEIIYSEIKKQGLSLDDVNGDGCGILMPAFENKFVDAEIPLNENEILWVDTLYGLMKDEQKLSAYVQKGLKRAEDFRTEMIMAEWKALIDEVLLEKKV